MSPSLASRLPPLRRAVLTLALCAVLPATAAAPRTLPIGNVQGSEARSAYEGRTVMVEGVVTADWRATLGGFFLQDSGDGNDATSDALFVQPGVDARVAAGDRVRVRGQVAETPAGAQAALTTLKAERIEVLKHGQPLPVRELAAAPADWRALEGEHVRIVAPLTLSGTDGLERNGELVVAFEGRLWQPSEVAAPGSARYAEVERDNARRRLVLDDGSSQRNPGQVAYLPADATLRTGTTFSAVEGIVDRRDDGNWRLQVTAPLTPPAVQHPAPPQVPGALRVASFNLENFFNGDGKGGGFPTLRGARTASEFQAQLAKLVATIRPLRADVAALMELENDGYGPESAIATLVNALNDGQGAAGDWRYVDAGKGPGTNPIRVGLIYRASKVKPLGKPVTLEGGPFVDHSRVPLAQAFSSVAGGKPFVVVANHFKSKGCSEATGADADQRDGQACWNATRVETARRTDEWLRTDPTGSGTQRAVLLGDFNAYAQEAPLRELYARGWQDAFAVAGVPQPYSYVYNGQTGRLDHALLSPAFVPALRGAVEWHINADEQDSLGYRERNVEGPWRSSDHDPLLLGFDP
ncbi:ExeM/NucH family extracellular endonuclease [Stenotrophomonas sp. HITSZ_GD]|uniref:ExeM/NucH family extracellular endonuclease n=1 Tax=Stenotrophomonas sp. HITSZ_GD TaxID=3037248 RepID=UPI00240E54F0|nr:ExeM/NucH family extracellular endonuclease [Stenotrophomonas sp. HITSZ_GD]MDG2523874.1 ExeM/NucH family extracellular endonuclease [Stenotrophomonas sp. HITSZ_GD]